MPSFLRPGFATWPEQLAVVVGVLVFAFVVVVMLRLAKKPEPLPLAHVHGRGLGRRLMNNKGRVVVALAVGAVAGSAVALVVSWFAHLIRLLGKL